MCLKGLEYRVVFDAYLNCSHGCHISLKGVVAGISGVASES